MERISRRVCVAVGSIAATCKAPRTGREVKDWGIHHSLTRAIGIGRAVLSARSRHEDPVAAIVGETGGRKLFGGKIIDVDRRTTEGFLRGRARLAGLDDDRGHELSLEFQNEFAMAWLDGRPCAMTPEIICVIDTVSGEAVGTETLRYGQRVTVAALPCPAILMTERGLTLVGPKAFGYDVEFRSVFA